MPNSRYAVPLKDVYPDLQKMLDGKDARVKDLENKSARAQENLECSEMLGDRLAGTILDLLQEIYRLRAGFEPRKEELEADIDELARNKNNMIKNLKDQNAILAERIDQMCTYARDSVPILSYRHIMEVAGKDWKMKYMSGSAERAKEVKNDKHNNDP